jgi:Cu+-exporting ATPase
MRKVTGWLLAGIFSMHAPSLSWSEQGPESGQPATAKLQVTQCALKVSGMTCGGCAGAVKQALLKLDGVRAATVDYQTGAAKVEYDSKKTSPVKIVAAFNQAGSNFRVGVSKPNAK